MTSRTFPVDLVRDVFVGLDVFWDHADGPIFIRLSTMYFLCGTARRIRRGCQSRRCKSCRHDDCVEMSFWTCWKPFGRVLETTWSLPDAGLRWLENVLGP